ncbi:MAG: hypothetical protein FWG08_04635 [Propionibacteriaceae bacterium]|nr:hypothetical protein [Propionibacteriaceae bacterium]
MDPLADQRLLERGEGVVDLSPREVVRFTGKDYCRLLHALGTQDLERLSAGETTSTYLLNPHGEILFPLALLGVEGAVLGWVEQGMGESLVDHVMGVRFRWDVEMEILPEMQVSWSPSPCEGYLQRSGTTGCLGGYEVFHLREESLRGQSVSLGAFTAYRIAQGIPQYGVDTDESTLPHELGLPLEYVSRTKGCYPGQEAVARISLQGSCPRRLARFHLDGSEERFVPGEQSTRGLPHQPLPAVLAHDPSVTIGFMGTVAYHHLLGPIGLGLVDSSLDAQTELLIDGVPARIELLVQ